MHSCSGGATVGKELVGAIGFVPHLFGEEPDPVGETLHRPDVRVGVATGGKLEVTPLAGE